jgi:CubicO group peptidase (beta-lactamase class C family)
MPDFLHTRRVICDAVTSGVAPCAVAEVGDARRTIWQAAAGRLAGDAASPAASPTTVFDLASLTKVLATTTLAMRLVDSGALDLAARVADVVPDWRRADRAAVTVADLLAHDSGLPAYAPLHHSCLEKQDFERAICSTPLTHPPRSASVYSDLGFMLLGFVLERVAGAPLDVQFDRMREALHGFQGEDTAARSGAPAEITFHPPIEWGDRIAPTRLRPASPRLVHDENAAALNGVAGHAGLFGTVSAVGWLARAMLRAVTGADAGPVVARRETAARFVTRVGTPGSSRALGWDTMLPSSSCGSRLSPRAFGHTGFTGTSLWVDPDAGLYFALLTNRVYPEVGSADGVRALRRAFHDTAMTDWAFSNRLD